jgi:RNA polymerase sigma-70 factor (ECF subfamily)
VDSLPESYRAVVVLADLEGLAYAEIANSLGVPVGTVRSRLARARAQLQKVLWIHAQDAGLTKPADTQRGMP